MERTSAAVTRRRRRTGQVDFGLVVNPRPHPDLVLVPLFHDAVDVFVAAASLPGGRPSGSSGHEAARARLREGPARLRRPRRPGQELIDLLAAAEPPPHAPALVRRPRAGEEPGARRAWAWRCSRGASPPTGRRAGSCASTPICLTSPTSISLVYRADLHRTRAAAAAQGRARRPRARDRRDGAAARERVADPRAVVGRGGDVGASGPPPLEEGRVGLDHLAEVVEHGADARRVPEVPVDRQPDAAHRLVRHRHVAQGRLHVAEEAGEERDAEPAEGGAERRGRAVGRQGDARAAGEALEPAGPAAARCWSTSSSTRSCAASSAGSRGGGRRRRYSSEA